MSANATAGIITEQHKDKHLHGMNLPFGTRIGRTTVVVETTFITDTNTMLIISLGVRPDSLYLAGSLNIPIFTDIEILPCPIETTPTMAHFQIIFRKISVRPYSGTVDHNQVNLPHQPVLSLFFLFSFCKRKTTLPIQLLRFYQSLFLAFY